MLSGLFKPEAHLDLLREPVSSRASKENVGSLEEMELELLVVGNVDVREPSFGLRKPTDDALLDEATRYPRNLKIPNFSLGSGASSSSPHISGPEGFVWGKVGISGVVGAVEESRSKVSPREEWLVDLSVHEDRNLSPCASRGEISGPELAIVPFGGVLESPLAGTMALQVEVGDGEEEWSSSCLAKFSHCLGMPTVGFEEEILYLLRRMRGRIEKKNQDRENKRTKSSVSKSSRELKKLEWSVSYKKAKLTSNEGKFGGAFGLGNK